MISPLTILFAWLGIFFIGMTFGLGFWFAGTVFKKRTYIALEDLIQMFKGEEDE